MLQHLAHSAQPGAAFGETGKQLPDAPNNPTRFNPTHTVNDSLTSNLTSSWREQTAR